MLLSQGGSRGGRFSTPVMYPYYQDEDASWGRSSAASSEQNQNLQSQILRSLVESQQQMLEMERQRLDIFRSSQGQTPRPAPRMIENPEQQLVDLKIQAAAAAGAARHAQTPTQRELIQGQLQSFEEQRAALRRNEAALEAEKEAGLELERAEAARAAEARREVIDGQNIAIQQQLATMLDEQNKRLAEKDAEIARLGARLAETQSRLAEARKRPARELRFSQALVRLVFCFKKAAGLVSGSLRLPRPPADADDVEKLESLAECFAHVVDQLGAEQDAKTSELAELRSGADALLRANADLRVQLGEARTRAA